VGGAGGTFAVNKVIVRKIEAALPDREVDTKVELKGPKNTVVTNISAIKVLDGWIQVSVN
jgi:hypothetical protein